MSLINDALKKAQKQRTGEAEPLPAIGGESAVRIARRGKPAGYTALIVRIGAGVVAVIAIVVTTVIFLRRSPAEVAPTKPVAPIQVPVTQAPAVQAPAPKPVEVAPPPVTAAPVIVVPPSAPVVVAAPVKIEPAQPKVETHAPVVVAAPVITVPETVTPRVTAPGKLEPRAITYIESIRVAGIRASGSDRKVLMNDRVYRLGDLVEPEMGLTLVGIAPNALTFQDERGGKYTRNF